MNHFSALEVKYLSQHGVTSVTRLMASMSTDLALSYVALGVLCVGLLTGGVDEHRRVRRAGRGSSGQGDVGEERYVVWG